MDADEANEAWRHDKDTIRESVALQNDIATGDFHAARSRLDEMPRWQALHVAVRAATYSGVQLQDSLIRFLVREDTNEGKAT